MCRLTIHRYELTIVVSLIILLYIHIIMGTLLATSAIDK